MLLQNSSTSQALFQDWEMLTFHIFLTFTSGKEMFDTLSFLCIL